jgi:hypothetical protein
MSTPRLKAIMMPAVKALFPPERIAREKATDLVITQDGRVRADRLHGQLKTENLIAIDASAITTVDITSVSLAASVEAALQDLADSIVDNAVVGVDTATIDITVTPTFAGTEISADLIKLTATATLDFPSIAAQTCSELTITVTGAAVGDEVRLGPPAAFEANLSATGIVTAADTVTVRVCNPSAGAINPASATWRATVK